MIATPQPLWISPSVPGLDVVRPARVLRLAQLERRPAQFFGQQYFGLLDSGPLKSGSLDSGLLKSGLLDSGSLDSGQQYQQQQYRGRRGAWLWPQQIAAGKVTVIVGENGLGKSSIAADLAARVSKGSPWPGQEETSAPWGTALIVCAAEEQFDLMPARLEGAGADFENICTLEAELSPDDSIGNPAMRPRPIIERLALVQAALEQLPDCKLVVIDPLSVYLDGPDGRRGGAVQMVMQGLAKLARRFGVAIVVVAHLTGTASLRAFSQFTATLGPPSAGRSVWGVLPDPDDGDRQLVLSLDGNFGKARETLSVRLADGDAAPMPHVDWSTAAPVSLRELIRASSGFRISERKYFDTENYVDLRLREVLAAGPVERSEIKQEIEASDEQLYRGAKRLGIVIQKKGYYDGWFWMLPEHLDKWQADQQQKRREQEVERQERKNAKRKWKRAERRAANEDEEFGWPGERQTTESSRQEASGAGVSWAAEPTGPQAAVPTGPQAAVSTGPQAAAPTEPQAAVSTGPQAAVPSRESFAEQADERCAPFAPQEHPARRAENVDQQSPPASENMHHAAATVGGAADAIASAASQAAAESPSDVALPAPLATQENPRRSVPLTASEVDRRQQTTDPPALDFGFTKPASAEEKAWHRDLIEKQRQRESEQAAADEQVEVRVDEDGGVWWVDDWNENDFKESGERVRDGPG